VNRDNTALDKSTLSGFLSDQGAIRRDGSPAPERLTRPVIAIIPAAGKGTRLDFKGPKVLFPIGSTTILKRLYKTIAPLCNEICLVVNPLDKSQIAQYSADADLPLLFAFQEEPTGMGDAILCAEVEVSRKCHNCDYLIIWGDQVTARRDTILRTLLFHQLWGDQPALTFPTCPMERPYIHFERDDEGRIMTLKQKREGDVMPSSGESDCGIFVVRGELLFDKLREYKSEAPAGSRTGEFNFLPFIVWLGQRRHNVVGLPIASVLETRGINTLTDAEFIAGENEH
jgi:bifunctional N-acetylglucosamine-1-phosphate-uridyltransferase/glucosamine-1-phosphate-acetyltransferase GlmU-like protein